MNPLNKEQISILEHTSNTGRYVSDLNEELRGLVVCGHLHDHGSQRLAGGMHYLTLTSAGRQWLEEWRAAQPRPEPVRLTRGQRRYQMFLAADCGFRFGDWLKTKRYEREERLCP